jgi:hypothetical protein
MNLLEFKRRLMTEPGDRSPEMRKARSQDADFAAAAAESEHFEHALKRALDVPTPPGLSDAIILRQSMQGQKRSMRWVQLGAVAAVLAIAFGVSQVIMDPATSAADLERHVVWHWKHDGPQVLSAALAGREDADHVQEILATFGVQIGPELLTQVRLTKYCPTPDGKGVHMVLDSPGGPVTVYYMPQTHLASSPVMMSLEDGMRAAAVNLERGSLTVLAGDGVDPASLAQEIARQMAIAPGTTI